MDIFFYKIEVDHCFKDQAVALVIEVDAVARTILWKQPRGTVCQGCKQVNGMVAKIMQDRIADLMLYDDLFGVAKITGLGSGDPKIGTRRFGQSLQSSEMLHLSMGIDVVGGIIGGHVNDDTKRLET